MYFFACAHFRNFVVVVCVRKILIIYFLNFLSAYCCCCQYFYFNQIDIFFREHSFFLHTQTHIHVDMKNLFVCICLCLAHTHACFAQFRAVAVNRLLFFYFFFSFLPTTLLTVSLCYVVGISAVYLLRHALGARVVELLSRRI